MHVHIVRYLFRVLVIAGALLLAACAPAPIYKTDASFVTATPDQVAGSPDNFSQARVVWGGSIIGVDNFKDHTEIKVLGYPLDSSQRPRLNKPAIGRFIAVVPGFLDPMNYPSGAPITVQGHVAGTKALPVGDATYTYTMVYVRHGAMHRWTPEEMREGHPNISIGVGVGGWIH
jgi:outer membrane lipoprotein